MSRNRRHRSGPPRWYDDHNNKTCDHDHDEYGSTTVKNATGYSDFGYYMNECGHPECDERWCWFIEG